ncbi:MAG: cation diffusion facilitator family transporter [Prevotellaceae bacterium]|jgi:cation diffusion facilitator family transporter|nr:cation diffusion facilitator family transporter [Prevotellaceae bacterium]
MNRKKEIYRVTGIGAVANAGLLVIKLAAGIAGNSAAMVADAVHSLSDFLTDVVVIAFVGLASKPRDESHSYGHGKFETAATLLIGLSLAAVGTGIFYSGSEHIVDFICGEATGRPKLVALVVALVSIVIKEWLYRYTAATSRRLGSEAVLANAWHHRSDAFSSIGTTLGIAGAIVLGDSWAVLDPIAAVVVSVFVVKASVGLIIRSAGELLEGSLSKETKDEIKSLAETTGAKDVHNLCTRKIGNRVAIEMHVRLPGDETVEKAHEVTREIERKLRDRFGADTHVTIHVEPMKGDFF